MNKENDNTDTNEKEQGLSDSLPKYVIHKLVEAFKIKDVVKDDGSLGATLVPGNKAFKPLKVDWLYVKKHSPKAGGYYVRHEDGEESCWSAQAFEAVYTPLDAEPYETDVDLDSNADEIPDGDLDDLDSDSGEVLDADLAETLEEKEIKDGQG